MLRINGRLFRQKGLYDADPTEYFHVTLLTPGGNCETAWQLVPQAVPLCGVNGSNSGADEGCRHLVRARANHFYLESTNDVEPCGLATSASNEQLTSAKTMITAAKHASGTR